MCTGQGNILNIKLGSEMYFEASSADLSFVNMLHPERC